MTYKKLTHKKNVHTKLMGKGQKMKKKLSYFCIWISISRVSSGKTPARSS